MTANSYTIKNPKSTLTNYSFCHSGSIFEPIEATPCPKVRKWADGGGPDELTTAHLKLRAKGLDVKPNSEIVSLAIHVRWNK